MRWLVFILLPLNLLAQDSYDNCEEIALQTYQVEGYWASDQFFWGFHDSIGLDDYFREDFENSIDNLKNK